MARPARDVGPPHTCYNRFVRWRRAGVWDQIVDALVAGHDAAVQMIDTSIVRVHQHGACIADNNQQDMGRSRGGLMGQTKRPELSFGPFVFDLSVTYAAADLAVGTSEMVFRICEAMA